jgi:hypothetical protein
MEETMRRYVYLLSAVTFVLSACGPEAGEAAALAAEEGPLGESSQAALAGVSPLLTPSSQVYLPPQPTLLDLTTARTWPTRLFPSTVKSAYTVYYNFYSFFTNTSTFYAFGYDVKSYRTVFVVRGYGSQRSAFKSEIDADLRTLAYEAASGLNTGYEGGRQIDQPSPPTPTPQVNEMATSAWDVSKEQYMVDVPQPLVYMPTGAVYYLQP